MITFITLPVAAALLHFAAPAEAEKPQNATTKSSSQASSSSISTRTENGQTTITCNGKEVWHGPTSNAVKSQSVSRNGNTFAAAFDGDKVIWESEEGAGAKVQDAVKDQVAVHADIDKKIAEAKQRLAEQEAELKKKVEELKKAQ